MAENYNLEQLFSLIVIIQRFVFQFYINVWEILKSNKSI